MIMTLGALTGATDRAERLAQELATSVAVRANTPRNCRANRRFISRSGMIR